MDGDERLGTADVPALTAAADRLDQLAETADLMGDDAGSARLRGMAADMRARALALLDD